MAGQVARTLTAETLVPQASVRVVREFRVVRTPNYPGAGTQTGVVVLSYYSVYCTDNPDKP